MTSLIREFIVNARMVRARSCPTQLRLHTVRADNVGGVSRSAPHTSQAYCCTSLFHPDQVLAVNTEMLIRRCF